MKALFVSAAVAALTLFGACSSADKADKAESTIASKIENCTNTDSLKAYVEEAKDYVVKLQQEGKLDEAKKFLDKIEPVVKEKAPALATAFTAVQGALDKVGDVASTNVDSLKTAAVDSVNSVVDAAKDSVASAANAAVDAAKAKAADAANAAVEQGKAKAADAVNSAAAKAADKIKGL